MNHVNGGLRRAAISLKSDKCLRVRPLAAGLSIALASLAMPVMAQQITVDGTSVVRDDPVVVDTGSIGGTPALVVNNAGTFTANDTVTFSTGGATSHVVYAINNGTANLMNGGSLTSTGAGAYAIYATGGGTVNADGLSISSSATSAYVNGGTLNIANSTLNANGFALHALNAGVINAHDVALNTTGNGQQAVEAYAGAQVNLTAANGSAITTLGNNSYGLISQVAGGSKITATGPLTITTSGTSAYGAYARTTGSIDLSGTRITTGGLNATGLAAESGGKITAKDVIVTTNGNDARALWAYESGSLIEVEGATITTTGGYGGGLNWAARGASAEAGGIIRLTDSDIATAGQFGFGVYATGSGSTVEVTGGSITTTGTTAAGAQNDSAGTIRLDGTEISTAGQSARGLYTVGTGSVIEMIGGSIATQGALANGAQATTGASLSLDGTVITTRGVTARGLSAESAARIEATNTTIETFGDGAAAVLANDATVQLTGVSIVTNGSQSGSNSSVGAYVTNGADVSLTDSSIVTNGFNAAGMVVEGGSYATLKDSNVSTTGNSARAVFASGNGSLVEIENATIATTGTYDGSVAGVTWGARGASATDSAIVRLTNSDVSTIGQAGYGLLANGGTVEMTGGSVATTGQSGHGLYSTSMIRLIDGDISTQGQSAHGLLASGAGTIEVTDSSVVTAGDSANGVRAIAGGQVTLAGANEVGTAGNTAYGLYSTGAGSLIQASNTSVATTGADSHAVLANDGGTVNLVQTGGTLSSVQGTTLASQAGMIDAVLDGVSVGNNGLLIDSSSLVSTVAAPVPEAVLGGSVNLSASNMTMSGDVQADTDSVANLSLFNSAWTGKASNGTDFSLDARSVWNVTDSSDVANLRNAGFIGFAGDTAGRTLTVHNQYNGEGGTLSLNTVLGDDNSSTDRLVIEGDSVGNTGLRINNVGGTGALTVADGIQVVQVGGNSGGQFALDGRVVAGLYEYQLFQGGASNSGDGNWYLRNTLLPVDPEIPVDPENPEPPKPIYRPEPFAYLANMTAATGMFQHTLHDRMGEPNYAERSRDGDRAMAGWVRVQGRQMQTRDQDQLGVDIDSWMVQAGVELGNWTAGDSRFHSGVMVGTGKSTTKVESELTRREAIGRVSGNSLGVYGTWYADAEQPTGLYVDSWLQYGRYKNEVLGQQLAKESYDSSTAAASVEAGYAFQLRDNGRSALFLEPQAQAIYSRYRSDDVTERDSGVQVRAGSHGDVTTRVGARLYGHTTNASHNKVQPFVETNWWHSAQGNWVAFNGERMEQSLPKDRYEVKLGAEVELGGNWTGWGHLGWQTGKEDYRNLDGLIGIKRVW